MGHSDTSETTGAACPTGGYWIGKQNNPARVALYYGEPLQGSVFQVVFNNPQLHWGLFMGNPYGILHLQFIVGCMRK
jgi:hypothetical protein